METTYYTLTAREIVVTGDAVKNVSGGARQLVCVRKADRPVEEAPVRGKVLDFTAWKAEREERARLEMEEDWYEEAEDSEVPAYQPRPRRDHKRTVLVGSELLATLSVIGAMALLTLRILVF